MGAGVAAKGLYPAHKWPLTPREAALLGLASWVVMDGALVAHFALVLLPLAESAMATKRRGQWRSSGALKQ
jgi:hypothetical protein